MTNQEVNLQSIEQIILYLSETHEDSTIAQCIDIADKFSEIVMNYLSGRDEPTERKS